MGNNWAGRNFRRDDAAGTSHGRYRAVTYTWEQVQEKIKEDIERIWGYYDEDNSDCWYCSGYDKKNCVICGRQFFCALKGTDRIKYCTRKCASKGYAKLRLERRKDVRNNLVCAYCGKEIIGAKRADKRFCSQWHKIKGLEAEKYAAKAGITLLDFKAEAAKKRKEEAEQKELARIKALMGR
jgi:hypothetical protein